MSLYIKKMELPDKHKDLYGYKQDYVDCRIWNDGTVQILYGGYASKSPYEAISVPPHGNLKDADAIRKDWLKNYRYALTRSILDSFDDAPIVIPAIEEGEV